MASFSKKALGVAKPILVFFVSRTEEKIMLDQERYIDELLQQFRNDRLTLP